MVKSTYCFIKVNVKEALQIRDEGFLITDSPKLFKCTECGRTVRPRTKGEGQKAHFAHLRRNPKCSLSDALD